MRCVDCDHIDYHDVRIGYRYDPYCTLTGRRLIDWHSTGGQVQYQKGVVPGCPLGYKYKNWIEKLEEDRRKTTNCNNCGKYGECEEFYRDQYLCKKCWDKQCIYDTITSWIIGIITVAIGIFLAWLTMP